MNYNSKLLSFLVIGLGFTVISCSKDDDSNDQKQKTEDLTTLKGDANEYSFSRKNKSTVSFSGQTTRLKQASEIGSAMKVTSNTAEKLSEMFKSAKGFTDKTLEGSKNLRSKSANSISLFQGGANSAADAYKATLDGYLNKQVTEVFPKWTTVAKAGTAGFVETGSKKRYVNAKGLEYDQAFMKSLIGGLVADQISNHYLNRLDDNYDGTGNWKTENTEGKLAEGKDYTTMEHHWDEAYGYLFGNIGADALLYKYLVKVDGDADFKGILKDTKTAFGQGRLAITQKNYTSRDKHIVTIRKNIAKVIAIRAIYYLKAGKSKLSTRADAFHDLSEGYGFIHSLRFISLDGKTPIFTGANVDSYLNELMANNGFWTVTTGKLDEIMKAIADKFTDITVDKV